MGTIIQWLFSLFGSSMKAKITDLILGSLLGGKSAAPAADGDGADRPAGNPLDDIMGRFKDKGLGDVFGSWVSTGKNKPISPDQVEDVIGSDQMGEMANKSGMSVDVLAKELSKYLPGVIDKLTPNGRLPGQ